MKHISQKKWFVIWMIALFLSFGSSLFADETYAPPTYRGKVILVVDKTVAADPQVSSRIERLRLDLIGDGWRVIRHDVERGPDWVDGSQETLVNQWAQQNAPMVREVRSTIKADYDAAPTEVKAVFLIGHVAIPYSGTGYEVAGGHYYGALPADPFYGEMSMPYEPDGWSDLETWTEVYYQAPWIRECANYAGDGKFDQNVTPAPMKLAVGRVDFYHMPEIFGVNETTLISRYFDKDHDFRCRVFSVQRRAIVNGYADTMKTVFGENNVLKFAHLQWFPNVSESGQDYLLGGAFGTGDGGGQHNIGRNTDFVTTDSRVVFVNLRGSWFGNWDQAGVLNTPLANPYDPANGRYGYGLDCIWGDGVPGSWGSGSGDMGGLDLPTLTHRSLGETIGEAIFVGHSPEVNIGLMGDPTLRMHSVLPVSSLTATKTDTTVTLSWMSSPDATEGYNIYHAPTRNGPFVLVNTAGPVTSTTYSAARPFTGDPDNFYMLRAVKTEVTPVGSYINMSEGSVVGIPGAMTPCLKILNNPANQLILLNTQGGIDDSVAFCVDAIGIDSAGNEQVKYQWYKNGALLEDDCHFQGTQTRGLLIRGVQFADAGSYSVVVENSKGSLTSTAASLSINALPIATDDTYDTYGNTPTDLHVLDNDYDPDGPHSGLQIVSISGPSTDNVGIVMNADHHTIHFTPIRGWFGTVTFTYIMTDGIGKSKATVTVHVTQHPSDQPPNISHIDDQSLVEHTVVNIPFTVSDDYSSPDELILKATSPNPAVFLNIIGTGANRILQIEGREPVSSDTVTLTATDEDNTTSTVSFDVTVAANPDLPLSSSPTITANEFSYSINGPAGSTWTVYSSTDLKNWMPVSVVTLVNGIGSFTDSHVNGVGYRFYKLSNGTCCSQAIGFERTMVKPGTETWIGNQLDSPVNTLGGLFNRGPNHTMPDGTSLPALTQIQKWNSTEQTWNTYTWNAQSDYHWRDSANQVADDVPLNPGEGATITTPPTADLVTVTFVGSVQEGQLTIPLSSGYNYSFVSSMVPQTGGIQSVLGFTPADYTEFILLRDGAEVVYIYDPTQGFSANYWYWYGSDGYTRCPEPVLNMGEAVLIFSCSDADETWTRDFSACAGGNVPALSLSQISGSAFSFNINGDADTSWTVCSSTDLENWTSAGDVKLNNSGAGSFLDNSINGVSYRFYKLSNGDYCSQAIGFERMTVAPGTETWIGNQLDSPVNTLGGLFNRGPNHTMPDGTALPAGTQIAKWNNVGQAWDTYTWNAQSDYHWRDSANQVTDNVPLNPGEGAIIITPTMANPVMVTFVGSVLEGQLTIPLYPGYNYYFVSSMVPQAGGIQSVLGFNPSDYTEVIQKRDGAWVTYIYDPTIGISPNNWYDSSGAIPCPEPVLNVGEAVFIFPCSDAGEIWTRNFSTCADGNVPVLSPGQVSGSTFSFNINGDANSSWTVFSSTDLENWTPVGSVTLDGNRNSSYNDMNVTGVSYRFYKLGNGAYCSQAIGFERMTVAPGTETWIGNQLDSPVNTLGGLFNRGPNHTMPDGTSLPALTQIQKWNSTEQTWNTYTWNAQSDYHWRDSANQVADNVPLNPGEGATITTPPTVNPVMVTFVGSVLEGQLTIPLSPGFNYYFVSSMVPQTGGIQSVLGFTPADYTEFILLRDGTEVLYIYDPTVGISPNNWYDSSGYTPSPEPVVDMGESVLIFPCTDADETWTRDFSASH